MTSAVSGLLSSQFWCQLMHVSVPTLPFGRASKSPATAKLEWIRKKEINTIHLILGRPFILPSYTPNLALHRFKKPLSDQITKLNDKSIWGKSLISSQKRLYFPAQSPLMTRFESESFTEPSTDRKKKGATPRLFKKKPHYLPIVNKKIRKR